MGPVLVAETDWLGFFSKHRVVENDENLLVYPKVESIPLPSSPVETAEESSYFDANASSLSEELFGLKEYTPGDDIRLIHWKTTSRTNKLFVRHREPESTKSIAIVLDIDKSSYSCEEEFEAGIKLCASLCQAAQSSNKRTIFLSNDQQETIYDNNMFLDKLCAQQAELQTVPMSMLSSAITKNQSDTFIITGSMSVFEYSSSTIFRITSLTAEYSDPQNTFRLKTDSVFDDYRNWVDIWNVRETLASH